jgi:hypothetical protein
MSLSVAQRSFRFGLNKANKLDVSRKFRELAQMNWEDFKYDIDVDFGPNARARVRLGNNNKPILVSVADPPLFLGTVDDFIQDLNIKVDLDANGTVNIKQLSDAQLEPFQIKLKDEGFPDDQITVMSNDRKAAVNNSELVKQSDISQQANSASSANKNSVSEAEVKENISDQKNDLSDSIDRSTVTTAQAKENLQKFFSTRDTARKATGGTPVIPKLERALESKGLLDAGEKLTKGAEASKASSKVKKWFKRLGVFIGAVSVLFVGAALEDIIALATETTLAAAAEEHQKDQNGCWLIDSIALTETKVKLLTCGTFDVSTAMETCASQTYTPANAATITKCPVTTFNPCAKSSRSRATDQSVPLVPDVCDMYLYKGTAPTAVTGVTTKNACLNTDGTPLKDTEACSVFCSTANFNLPSHQVLVCRSLTYPEAYAHLLATIGVDPSKVFPPKGETNPTETSGAPQLTAVSKPLVITAAVLGGVFLILLVIYFVW